MKYNKIFKKYLFRNKKNILSLQPKILRINY
jgi:hypothetical protein